LPAATTRQSLDLLQIPPVGRLKPHTATDLSCFLRNWLQRQFQSQQIEVNRLAACRTDAVVGFAPHVTPLAETLELLRGELLSILRQERLLNLSHRGALLL